MGKITERIPFPKDQNEVEANWLHVAFFISEKLFGNEIFFYMREEHCDLLPVADGEIVIDELSAIERTWCMLPEAAVKLAKDHYHKDLIPLEELDRIRRSSEALRALFWCIVHRNHPNLPEGGLKIRAGFKVAQEFL